MAIAPDQSRRNFLRGRPGAGKPPVRPPGALAEVRFLDNCSRCDDCAVACSQGIIVRGEGGFPQVDFNRGECTFCGDCAAACETGAIVESGPGAWNLTWEVSDACLARNGVICQSCRDECPQSAIRFEPRLGTVALPELDEGLCNSCGACVAACPADAIGLHHG